MGIVSGSMRGTCKHVCACARHADLDCVDYNNMLRSGIIDAYSGIIQGLGQGKGHALRSEVPAILEFLSSIGGDQEGQEADEGDVARTAVNLLGDICSVVPVSTRKLWACCSVSVLQGMRGRVPLSQARGICCHGPGVR